MSHPYLIPQIFPNAKPSFFVVCPPGAPPFALEKLAPRFVPYTCIERGVVLLLIIVLILLLIIASPVSVIHMIRYIELDLDHVYQYGNNTGCRYTSYTLYIQ